MVAFAAQANHSYIHYSVDKGLSSNSVSAVLQDSEGYMWFGTKDGLNRFDGYTFKVFRITDFIHDKNLIGASNFIRSLLEVPEWSQIWVGTELGIFVFDTQKEVFVDFKPTSDEGVAVNQTVSSMVEDHLGNIWIASSGQGIFKYEKKSGHLRLYRRAQPNEFSAGTIITDHSWTLCVDDYNIVWASTFKSGICRYDSREDRFVFHPIDTDSAIKLYSLNYDSQEKCIWIGTLVSGLYKFDVKNYTWEKIDYKVNGKEIDLVHCFAKTSLNNMLVGSKDGLTKLNLATLKCEQLEKGNNPSELSMQTVTSMHIDREGGIWLGTEYSGVFYLFPQLDAIMRYKLPNADNLSVEGRVVSGFAPRADGKIWVGSHDCGVSLFDPSTQRIIPFVHPLIQHDANCLFDDGRYLWVGNINNGLVKIDYENGGKAESFQAKKVLDFTKEQRLVTDSLGKYYAQEMEASTISHNTIFSIYKTRKGKLLVGTQYGLNEYDEQKGIFKLWSWSFEIQINDIVEDDQNRIWVATEKDGIMCYDPVSGKLFKYQNDLKKNSLPNDHVTCLFKDHLNHIWAGTLGTGLCFFNENDQSFIVFGKSKGMPSEVITSIEEDQMGNLWIGTSSALVQLSPTFQIRCFDDNSGMQSKMFNDRASYFDPERHLLYEGGINGFNVISPALLSDNDILPSVKISAFYLNNQDIVQLPEENELYHHLLAGETLVLKPIYKSIGFDIASMSYVVPSQNRYAYRMENFDEHWNYTQGKTHILYNLPSGKYVLCIRTSNNSGLWSNQELRLPIHVLPPVWCSLPLILCYILSLFAIAAWTVMRIRRNIRRRRHLNSMREEIAKGKEFYNMKVKFLINVAHDIRILLSLIAAPLEIAIKNCDQNKNSLVRECLETIQRNSDRLNALANQIMDFNKIGRDEFQFNFEMNDIVPCIVQTTKQFSQTLALNNIELTVNVPDDPVLCWIDNDSITKAIYNLLSNAMKYTKDSITLNLSADDKNIHIEVINNGREIAPEFQKKIFLPFYQEKENGINNNKGGSGIGLTIVKYVVDKHNGEITILSEPTKTAFVIDIPRVVNQAEKAETDQKPTISLIPNTAIDTQPTLLVVEDEAELLRFLAKILGDKYNVYEACNGKEAVKILESQKIDLILTDVMMDEMDGLELCRYVRTTPILCHIPVIMLTGKTDVTSKISGVEQGADLYIDKPFSMALLQTQISALLQNRELISKAFKKHIFMPPQSVSENIDDVKFMEKLNSLIDAHIDMSEGLIEFLAEEMSMSRSNMHKKIKTLSGMTPNDYIQLARLKKAADLLCTTNYKINEISSMTGFNTPSYFAKCFFNRFGILPKDFVRDKHRSAE